MNTKITSDVSYAAAAWAVISALTLNDLGVLTGILAAVTTAAFNWHYARQRREEEKQRREEEREIHQLRKDFMTRRGSDESMVD